VRREHLASRGASSSISASAQPFERGTYRINCGIQSPPFVCSIALRRTGIDHCAAQRRSRADRESGRRADRRKARARSRRRRWYPRYDFCRISA